MPGDELMKFHGNLSLDFSARSEVISSNSNSNSNSNKEIQYPIMSKVQVPPLLLLVAVALVFADAATDGRYFTGDAIVGDRSRKVIFSSKISDVFLSVMKVRPRR